MSEDYNSASSLPPLVIGGSKSDWQSGSETPVSSSAVNSPSHRKSSSDLGGDHDEKAPGRPGKKTPTGPSTTSSMHKSRVSSTETPTKPEKKEKADEDVAISTPSWHPSLTIVIPDDKSATPDPNLHFLLTSPQSGLDDEMWEAILTTTKADSIAAKASQPRGRWTEAAASFVHRLIEGAARGSVVRNFSGSFGCVLIFAGDSVYAKIGGFALALAASIPPFMQATGGVDNASALFNKMLYEEEGWTWNRFRFVLSTLAGMATAMGFGYMGHDGFTDFSDNVWPALSAAWVLWTVFGIITTGQFPMYADKNFNIGLTDVYKKIKNDFWNWKTLVAPFNLVLAAVAVVSNLRYGENLAASQLGLGPKGSLLFGITSSCGPWAMNFRDVQNMLDASLPRIPPDLWGAAAWFSGLSAASNVYYTYKSVSDPAQRIAITGISAFYNAVPKILSFVKDTIKKRISRFKKDVADAIKITGTKSLSAQSRPRIEKLGKKGDILDEIQSYWVAAKKDHNQAINLDIAIGCLKLAVEEIIGELRIKRSHDELITALEESYAALIEFLPSEEMRKNAALPGAEKYTYYAKISACLRRNPHQVSTELPEWKTSAGGKSSSSSQMADMEDTPAGRKRRCNAFSWSPNFKWGSSTTKTPVSERSSLLASDTSAKSPEPSCNIL